MARTPVDTLKTAPAIGFALALALVLAACHRGPPDSSTIEPSTLSPDANPYNPVTGTFEPVAASEFANAKQVGDCNVDQVNGQVTSTLAALDHRGTGQFIGWLGDRASGKVPPSFQLILTGARDYAVKGETGKFRPDVASGSGVKAFATSGYQLNAVMSDVGIGSYGVTLVYAMGGVQVACVTNVHVAVQ